MGGDARKVLGSTGNFPAISMQEVRYLIAGVEIDPARASVTRDGEAIDLRPKTYQVLLFLLQRPNRLVSKDELLEGVWPGTAVSDDVLPHCIAELRKAFGDQAKEQRVIKTYPKSGYGLVAPIEIHEAEPTPVIVIPAGDRQPRRNRRPMAMAAGAIVLLSIAGICGLVWMRPAPVEILREVAWWKLDEGHGLTASDTSGNGQSGKLTGTAAWVPGKRSMAVAFSGTEASVRGASGRALPGGSAPRTITAWFKTTAPPVDDTIIFEYGSDYRGATPERFGVLMRSDGRISFGSAISGGSSEGTGQWADQSWHMLAAAYEGPPTNMARIFVDGRVESTAKWTAIPATNNRLSWSIGRSLLGNSSFLGAIDDVRVYNDALDVSKVAALYRCASQPEDLGSYYYLSILYPGMVSEERAPGDLSTPFRQAGVGLGGMQLAMKRPDCSIAMQRGADVGQDLRIAADILVPVDAEGRTTEAGPYFRARSASAGDGIVGGTAAGYWLQLESSGRMRVQRLNPRAVIAFANAIPGFDSTVFHHLEMEARGETLTAWLDGKPVEFLEGDKRETQVPIPPVWDGPPRLGRNQGAAGVAFSSDQSRNQAGGQRVKNLQVIRIN
jgi:DNA-binding winged helix-turn-helix (wHTH) protein